METDHITIPQKPTVEVIEAMVEAALDNKNNLEAIYKAVVAHFNAEHRRYAAPSEPNQITRVVVCEGKTKLTNTAFVAMTAYVGPRQVPAVGYFPASVARSLAKDLKLMADVAEGKL